jgi:hypothetical protein
MTNIEYYYGIQTLLSDCAGLLAQPPWHRDKIELAEWIGELQRETDRRKALILQATINPL